MVATVVSFLHDIMKLKELFETKEKSIEVSLWEMARLIVVTI